MRAELTILSFPFITQSVNDSSLNLLNRQKQINSSFEVRIGNASEKFAALLPGGSAGETEKSAVKLVHNLTMTRQH
jgi:hypothetical protein